MADFGSPVAGPAMDDLTQKLPNRSSVLKVGGHFKDQHPIFVAVMVRALWRELLRAGIRERRSRDRCEFAIARVVPRGCDRLAELSHINRQSISRWVVNDGGRSVRNPRRR